MIINIITIFPEFFKASFGYSILKRAQQKGIIEVNILNLRDWAKDNYGTIDNPPYGGGPGMVMMLPPVYEALKSIKFPKNVVLPSAKGKIWNQNKAQEFSKFSEITFIVPHFEGIDQRVIDNLVDYEFSVGPYVLSGGELPTMTIIDSITRLIPGALGNPESLLEESFSISRNESESNIITDELTEVEYLEYPQYTRPQIFKTENGEEWNVPDILLSGNHAEIKKWRESEIKTKIDIN